jgi:cell division transport system permease protein
MTIASVITLAGCLFIVSISYCIASNIDYLLFQMESLLSITVYISQDSSSEDVNNLVKLIRDIPHVSNVEYISSEDALAQFRENLGDSSHILDGLESDNPLPRSFVLDIETLGYWDYVVNRLDELKGEGIDTIKHGKQAVNILITINNVLRVICVIIIAGLGIISIVIIFNTIKLAVNSRKTEINIMKYVGATDAFIRWPFIIEGMIIGVLGAMVPTFLIHTVYTPAIELVKNSLSILDFDFRTRAYIFTILIPLLGILGVFIGVLGSVTSIRQHLNV